MHCNAGKHNSMLYRCLRLPKTKRKNMHRSSISSPHKNFIIMFARLYKTANVLRASSFVRRRLLFYYLLRCHAAIQRDRDLCDLYRLCFGNDFAHFLFVYIYRSSPVKIKNSRGSKIIPMYSSVTFQLQQCSARDMRLSCSFFRLFI